MTVDLGPAARQMADVIRGISDDQLGGPTPCPAYTLGDLVEHVGGLTRAFTAAAAKDTAVTGSQGPSGDASRLPPDWRSRIPRDLDTLADAWRRPEAWQGMTRAGGIDLPGAVAGLVTLDELVVHGWDLARASGQPFDCDPGLLTALHPFVARFDEPGQEQARQGLFGPVVAVPDDAPLLDRVIGLTGRDPAWTPGTAAAGAR